jgi:hypothetical protein
MSQKIEFLTGRYLPNNLCVDKMAQKVNKFVYDAAERRKANFVLFFSKITF